MIAMKRLGVDLVPWEILDEFADRTVFQTLPWLNFVAQTQAAEPVVAVVQEDGRILGYFTGLIVRKLGLKILGSPFKGWTTAYMGFNLLPGVPRCKALQALPSFAFKDLGCHYLEMVERRMCKDDYGDLAYAVQDLASFEIDLTKSEAELFASMYKTRCQMFIRKAEKCGVVVEEAHDLDFADDYYAQLKDVFAKQSLVPTYGIDRVRELIKCLYPSGHLLLLRARDADGLCIATGIFPAFNDTAFFWGGASWRQHQNLRPNEPLMWYAMRYWKARGIKKFDLAGKGEYKRKYGGYEIGVPRLMKARYDGLIPLRNLAQRAWKLSQIVSGRLRKR